MEKVFRFRDGFRVPKGADALAIHQELERFQGPSGAIDMEAALEDARTNEASPLRVLITTDEQEALDKLHKAELRAAVGAIERFDQGRWRRAWLNVQGGGMMKVAGMLRANYTLQRGVQKAQGEDDDQEPQPLEDMKPVVRGFYPAAQVAEDPELFDAAASALSSHLDGLIRVLRDLVEAADAEQVGEQRLQALARVQQSVAQAQLAALELQAA